MWFEPDDCSRVANNVISFAINSVEKIRDDCSSNELCLQFATLNRPNAL